ncbi:hypothetical protein FRC06_000919 [Ceratobasidium sp. 370]|nr:hypothetical protein FRC06_000919 [Ceratobasidium sp. 370]
MPNAVLMSDGKVFIVNGATGGTAGYGNVQNQVGQSNADGPVLQPVIYDPNAPAGQRFSSEGLPTSDIPRLYHSTSSMLPDGSIIIAGSNPNLDVATWKYPTEYRVEMFSPPYVNQPRPEIITFDNILQYGRTSRVTLKLPPGSRTRDTQEVNCSLMDLGFSTHGVHMDQRMVLLSTTQSGRLLGLLGDSQVLITGPPNAYIYPPGPGWLGCSVNGVPSPLVKIMVGTGQGPPVDQGAIDKLSTQRSAVAPVRIMNEDEVASGFYSGLVTALKNGRDKGLLDNEDLIGGEERLVVCGLALLLSYAASEAETAAPSIPLPCPEESDRRLDTLTCPSGLYPYFDRWANIVPRIQSLSPDHAVDLAHLICRKMPVTLPKELPDPYPFFPTFEQQARREIRDLSSELFTISHAISTHRSFLSLKNRPLNAVLSENHASSSNQIPPTISSSMSMLEVADILIQHGCLNLSGELDIPSLPAYPISRGVFGDVYSGRLRSGTPIAVQTMMIPGDDYGLGHKHLKRAARELYHWSKCHHSNIIRLLGLVEFRGQIATVSPRMENGDLRTYVNKYSNADRFSLCAQIANAVAYLHDVGIIHGHLKGDNVLISKEGTAMLVNFGTSVFTESTLQFTQTSANQFMTVRWTAPEVLEGDRRSTAADVYALGMP